MPPPLDPEDGGGGGGSGWVRLLRAPNDIEGHLLAGRLHEAGVEARIVREKGAPSAWLYGASKPWAPVVVMVRRRQLEDARMVLAEVSFEAPDHVRQVAVDDAADWRVPVVWWATAIALGVLVLLVAVISRSPLGITKSLEPAAHATLDAVLAVVLAGGGGRRVVLARLAGVVGGSALSLSTGEDQRYLLASLIVVIIGGMGSLGGAAIGALLVGLVEQYGLYYAPYYSATITVALMVAVLAVRPQGLLGRPA